jgi:hypothetical protein
MLIRTAVEKKIQKRNNTNLIISVSSVVIDKYGMGTDTTGKEEQQSCLSIRATLSTRFLAPVVSGCAQSLAG